MGIYLPEKVVNPESPRSLWKTPANSPDNCSAPVQTDICAEREKWAFGPRVVTTDHRARAWPTLIPGAQGSQKDHKATGRGAWAVAHQDPSCPLMKQRPRPEDASSCLQLCCLRALAATRSQVWVPGIMEA